MADNSLSHYGILGMKWGVRRDLGPDGRIKNSPVSEDRFKVDVIKKKSINTLSNAELRLFNERANLEKQFKDLSKGSVSSGRDMALKILKNSGTAAATTLATGAMVYGGKKLIAAKFGEDVVKAMFRKK